MNELTHYLLGQMLQATRSIESGQHEMSSELGKLRSEVKDAITWGQRLVLMGLTWAAAISLNVAPDKVGKDLASFLHGLK